MRRRLDTELVRRGLAVSRRGAVEAIAAGRVLVGGVPARTPARRVTEAEAIRLAGEPARFVSRGGEKLAAALARFRIDVRGRRALDAGASTGGFTDCLLHAGASDVIAVDVGRGQLAWRLRTDPRVTLLERTNVRTLEPEMLDGPVPLCTADLSFISLRLCAPALGGCTTEDADLVLLAKPQFEAGPDRVGKGGVVRDPGVHEEVLREVRNGLANSALLVVAVAPSPLRGAEGNVEFFLHCRKDAAAVVDDAAIRGAVEEAHEGSRA